MRASVAEPARLPVRVSRKRVVIEARDRSRGDRPAAGWQRKDQQANREQYARVHHFRKFLVLRFSLCRNSPRPFPTPACTRLGLSEYEYEYRYRGVRLRLRVQGSRVQTGHSSKFIPLQAIACDRLVGDRNFVWEKHGRGKLKQRGGSVIGGVPRSRSGNH